MDNSYLGTYGKGNSYNQHNLRTPSQSQFQHQQSSSHLRYSNPVTQDYFLNGDQSQKSIDLRKQLNDEYRRHNALLQEVNQLEYQNAQIRNNYNTYQSSSESALREENHRLRAEIERRQKQINVPQHLIDQLEDLRQENSQLRRNAANLTQKYSRNNY